MSSVAGQFGIRVLIGIMLLLTVAVRDQAAEPNSSQPTFPRIGNCYGARLGSESWEKGGRYWSKLGLIIGGCYDLHYDWEHARWPAVLTRVEQNLLQLRKVNPQVIVLPYVDVVEGPDNPNVPNQWWDLKDGKRWSGWPGYFRINTALPEVMQFNLDKVQSEILGRSFFDGVFYDCWHPDPWLVPKTAQLRDGRAIVMVNDWNLPTAGWEHLNGCLAEDEFNRVIEGKVDFEEFLNRYLRWCRDSRRPVVTMLVGHPRRLDMDPWRWANTTWRERTQVRAGLETADLQTMRFGLCTTLMGDGYFGYDSANLGRGDWWWYPEYDAPLGDPCDPARKNPDGTWQRDFQGGLVIVNGTLYDTVVRLEKPHQNFSTGDVRTQFTVPSFDGRILVPTDESPSPGTDPAPRITHQPPQTLRATPLDDGQWAIQTPTGLELRMAEHGELSHVFWHGRRLITGGWPVVLATSQRSFAAQTNAHAEVQANVETAVLKFQGVLTSEEQRVKYVETCTARPDNSFTLRFDFTAETDLKLRMWRHYFALPVSTYAGAEARGDAVTVTLPKQRTNEPLLPGAKQVTVTTGEAVITVESSLPLSLVDHRRWGTEEYLLAGYPVQGEVPAGKQWSVEIRLAVSQPTGR
jgi:hypothetical protein